MATPIELGQQTQLAFIQELIAGTTPSTPTGQILRWEPGTDFGADAPWISNPELRADMMVAAGNRGVLRPKGSVKGVLTYGTYDPFLAAVTGNFAWASNVVKVQAAIAGSHASVTVAAAGKTFTRPSGSYVTDGFVVGDYIQTSGFTNSGNNGTFVISAVSATVITCSTATGLVDESSSTTGKITRNLRPSFSIEKAHLANGIYLPYLGCVVDSLELTGKVNSPVEVNIGLMGLTASTEAGSSIFTGLTAANTNPLITSWAGTIKKNTVSLGTIVSWSLKADRNADAAEVCGSSSLYDIQPKAAKVTGQLEIYFDSIAQYTDFRAQNDVALQFNLGPGGSQSYTIDLTRCKFTGWGAAPKDGMITQTVQFESFVPASGTNTSLMITRLP